MPLLRRSLLRLRPTTNTSQSNLTELLFQPRCRTRTFHASPRPQSLFLQTIALSHDAFTALHTATGLPWAYTIPLVALLLRTTLILPITIYSRRAHIKRIALSPLIEAWKRICYKQTMREAHHLGPVKVHNTVLEKGRAKRIEIYGRNGCGYWKDYLAIIQIPVFLSAMEALREMCGSNPGMLGLLIGGDSGTETEVENTAAVLTGDGLVDSMVKIPLEPSLATEGALWFPNLVIADPNLVLPFVLSGTLLLNMTKGLKKYDAMGVGKRRFVRGLGVIALAVGPMTLNIPSALHLYWISSSGLAYLQAVLLDRFMPLPKPIAPLVPKGQWKSGLGEPKPAGYVNPLLMMDHAAAARMFKANKAPRGPRPPRPVSDHHQPIRKSSPRKSE